MNSTDTMEWYFTKDDYKTFNEVNQTSISKDVMSSRRLVRDKLLNINDDLMKLIKAHKLDLHTHPTNSKIVSSIVPNQFNQGKVDWLGIRYGRSKSDLALLNFGLSKADGDDILGFQKYTCMQVDVCSTGVEVGIYHAVPYNSVDRAFTHERISSEVNYKHRLVEAIRKLKGHNLEWRIYNTTTRTLSVFDIDERNAEDFINFYETYDKEGCYSSLMFHYAILDTRISDDNILNTIFESISVLYDLYKLLIWKPKMEVV